MALYVHLTPKSKNEKTGPIPVSTSTAMTCPKTCPFNNANEGGCYAEQGPLKLHWKAVTEGKRGSNWSAFCDQIEALPDGQLWRHNQAGDLPGDGNRIDPKALARLTGANEGKRGFTYTHYDVETDTLNRNAVRLANAMGFTVNLSANSPAHADRLAETQAGPVVTVLPSDTQRGKDETLTDYRKRIAFMSTPEGRKITICPATYQDNVSCATCGLCQRITNRAIVGFPAHGTAKRKADKAVYQSDAQAFPMAAE